MKLWIFFASLFLLAGCQTIQPVEKKPQAADIETVSTDNDASLDAVPNIIDIIDTQPPKPSSVSHVKKTPTITPQQQKNVWDRIAMQIDTPIPNNKRIRYYRNWYLKHPRNLQIISERAQPFLYYITKEVEKRGMPLEIALLPIVESSFDTHAYSGSSAAGLWQIIPDTGRRFGLKQTHWYDGRRDVIKSTNAALNLLEYLHKKFDGNWQHALAAYNTGEGRVFSAIKKNKAAKKPTHFWALDLPSETSSYVPKLYAVADIIKHKEKYGMLLKPISNKPAVDVVNTHTQIDLDIAAQFAGLSKKTLVALNPAYRRGVTAPTINHLLLPVNNISTFKRAFANNKHRSLSTVTTLYTVKSGDSLGMIAQRHRTSVAALKQLNHLKSHHIRIGQKLKVFASTTAQSRTASGNTLTPKQHTVRSGDNLWAIARQYGTTVSVLAKTNQLSTTATLRLGQTLTLPNTVKAISSRTAATTPAQTIRYKVKRGDSLSVIAQRHNVTVKQIMKWNNLTNNNYLKQGQTLKLVISDRKVKA